MKLKHKISLLVIGILLVVSLLISSSYALWVFNVSQESTNVLVSDCFEITLTDNNNSIGLSSSFPMRDSDGVQTTPYEFTLTNICGQAADISINLETLNDSQIDGENLRVDVNGHIHTYGDNNSVEPTLDNASSAASFYNDTIASGKSKSYNLRLWIKEDANRDNVINKSLDSKITVRSTLRKNYSEATLKKGRDVNALLKSLADNDSPSYYTQDTSILSIQRSNDFPDGRVNYVNIADDNSEKLVYAWFDEGTISIYSDADTIYLNSDSEYIFGYFAALEDIDLSFFNTSNAQDVSSMFAGVTKVTTLNLDNFDTSNVEDMSYMFSRMGGLIELDLSNFNTSNVVDMTAMFYRAEKIKNLDLSNFNTSNVTDMDDMFEDMYNLEKINLSSFNTSAATRMDWMFKYDRKLEYLDVSHFDTSKVTNMYGMFEGSRGLKSLDVSNWNTSNVTDFNAIFAGLSLIEELDVSNFDVSNATRLSRAFENMSSLKHLDLSMWDTRSVKDIGSMFEGLTSIVELDISNFNVDNVTSMHRTFYNMKNLESFKLPDFSNAKLSTLSQVFYGLEKITELDLSSWNTSNVMSMDYMFYNMKKLETLDISNFNTSKTLFMHDMFGNMNNIKTIYIGNGWDISNLNADDNPQSSPGSLRMFLGDTNLVGGSGTTYDSNHTDKEYAHVDGGTSNPGYFTLKTN